MTDMAARTAFPIGLALSLRELNQTPYSIIERLRREEPVSWFAEQRAWLVCDRELIDVVLTDQSRFHSDVVVGSDRRALGVTMLTVDDFRHALHRKPFDGALRSRAVRDNFADPLRTMVAEAIAGIRSLEACDLVVDFARPLGRAVACEILGFSREHEQEIGALIDHVVAAMEVPDSDPNGGESAPVRSVTAARQSFCGRVMAAIERAPSRSEPCVLAQAAGNLDRRLGPQEVADNVVNLLFGIVDTIVVLLTTCVWALLTHPDQLERVRQDRTLGVRAIDEAARWRAPFGTGSRWARTDTELRSAHIRRGERVFAVLPAANRDPATFDEPDRFDVGRESLGSLMRSFGRGMHFCIGLNLTRLVATEALNGLLDSLPSLRLVRSCPSDGPTGFHVHRLTSLDVAWDHHHQPTVLGALRW